MQRWSATLALALAFATTAEAAAQAGAPDLSGTWRLDEQASTIDPAVPYAGLGGNAAAPTMLYVTQARNGTIVVGSNMNTSHARTYRVGGEGVTPLAAGELRLQSRWEGGTLVAEGTDSSAQATVHETLALEDSSRRLVVGIRRTSSGSEGPTGWAKLV